MVATLVSTILLAACVLLTLRGVLGQKIYFSAHPEPSPMGLARTLALEKNSSCACSGVPGQLYQPPGMREDQPELPSCLAQPADLGLPQNLLPPKLQRGSMGTDLGPCYVRDGNFGGSCLESSSSRTRPTVFLLGDSHAIAYAPSVFRAVGKVMDVRSLGRGGMWECLVQAAAESEDVNQAVCDSLFEFVESSVKASDVVVVAFSFAGIIDYGRQADMVTDYLQKLAKSVKSKGSTLVVLGDYVDFTNAGCIFNTYEDPIGDCWVSNDADRTGRTLDEHIAEEAGSSGYLFLKVRDLFCEDGGCRPFFPGTQVMAYSDFGHISWDGAAYLAPFICSFFEEHGISSGLV